MKKSKIIVPALAVLCLSTAAAVSGTVAWFSAGRDAKISTTSTVINPEGDLKCELTPQINTAFAGTTENPETKSIVMAAGTYLRDSSVAISGNSFKTYRAILADETPTGYAEVTAAENNKEIKDDKGVTKIVGYYATFKMAFSVPGAASTAKYDLFFNPDASTYFTPTAPVEGQAGDKDNVQSAYRVGMYNADHKVIYAPGHAKGGNLDYVTGTTIDDVSTYTNASANKITTASTMNDAETTNKFLGTIEGTKVLEINVVMWYEGSDEMCTTDVLDFLNTSSKTYTLAFNAINQNDFAKVSA